MINKTLAVLIFLILTSLHLACGSVPFKRDVVDYHSPRFTCLSSPGWRDEAKFPRYMEVWTGIRFLYHAENDKIKTAKTVIIGNSLVHLFTPDLMAQEFPGQPIVNRGIGGDMTETLLLRIEEDALTLKPQTVIIEIGGNDLIQGKCLSLIQDNIQAIVQKIRVVLPKTRIVFISIPPTDVPALNAVVPAMNSYLASLTQQYPNLVFVDTWPYMRDKDLPTIRRDMLREGTGDKIHFNEKGYSVWGRMLRPLL